MAGIYPRKPSPSNRNRNQAPKLFDLRRREGFLPSMRIGGNRLPTPSSPRRCGMAWFWREHEGFVVCVVGVRGGGGDFGRGDFTNNLWKFTLSLANHGRSSTTRAEGGSARGLPKRRHCRSRRKRRKRKGRVETQRGSHPRRCTRHASLPCESNPSASIADSAWKAFQSRFSAARPP